MIKFTKLISTLFSSILLVSTTTYAQTERERTEAYINQYKELAISEMLRTGVPASVTLAQGILETAGGQSDLASLANNHFGIKCKSEWTGETMSHDDDAKNECFRKYSSVEESYKDHSDFLRSRPAYAFLFKLDPTDYEGWAKGLKKAGYATNSSYAHSLIRLIVENHLQDFTLLAMQQSGMGNEIYAVNNANISDDESVDARTTAVASNNKTTPVNRSSYPSNSVFNINELKVIYAEAGTSLLAVANNYNVAFKKLLEFNELEETDIIKAGQLIYLEKKGKKGTKDVHIVEENESLRDIAQKEGIQLASIMEYNRLQKGMQPAPGEKIYLKSLAPVSPRLASVTTHKADVSM